MKIRSLMVLFVTLSKESKQCYLLVVSAIFGFTIDRNILGMKIFVEGIGSMILVVSGYFELVLRVVLLKQLMRCKCFGGRGLILQHS